MQAIVNTLYMSVRPKELERSVLNPRLRWPKRLRIARVGNADLVVFKNLLRCVQSFQRQDMAIFLAITAKRRRSRREQQEESPSAIRLSLQLKWWFLDSNRIKVTYSACQLGTCLTLGLSWDWNAQPKKTFLPDLLCPPLAVAAEIVSKWYLLTKFAPISQTRLSFQAIQQGGGEVRSAQSIQLFIPPLILFQSTCPIPSWNHHLLPFRLCYRHISSTLHLWSHLQWSLQKTRISSFSSLVPRQFLISTLRSLFQLGSTANLRRTFSIERWPIGVFVETTFSTSSTVIPLPLIAISPLGAQKRRTSCVYRFIFDGETDHVVTAEPTFSISFQVFHSIMLLRALEKWMRSTSLCLKEVETVA